jgi:hypothetical protein
MGSHYLRDYWRELPRRALRDAQGDFASHAWWEVALVLALVIAAPTTVASLINLKHGLTTLVVSIGVVYLWYLLAVTPARIKRDLDARHEADQAAIGEIKAREAEVKKEGFPVVDDRLELIEVRAEIGTTEPALFFRFRTKVPIDRPTITITCDAAIYRADANCYNTQTKERTSFPKPIKKTLYNKAEISFGDKPIAPGSVLSITIYSPSLPRLMAAKVGRIDV